MRIQRTMKIAAACAALAGSAAVVAANIPIKGTPCTGKWAECDAPRSALEKPGWKLTFSDDFDKPRLRDKNWFTSYRAGRKDWFARMGIPSRFEDPDAHYVIEDGIRGADAAEGDADLAGAVPAGRASEVRGLAEAHSGRPSLSARLRDRLRARLRPRVNGIWRVRHLAG